MDDAASVPRPGNLEESHQAKDTGSRTGSLDEGSNECFDEARQKGRYFVPARSAPQSKNGRRDSRRLTLANLPSYQRLRRFDFLCFLQFLCHRCSSLEAIPLLLLQGHRLFEFLGLLQALRHGCSPLAGSRSTPCAASASRVYVQMAGQRRGKDGRNASAAESCR